MKLLSLIITCLLLIGCAEQNHKDSGIETQGMDTSVKAQDDFFHYANGQWLKDTAIPAQESSWGSFYVLRDQSLENLKAIIDEIIATPAQKRSAKQASLFNLYNSFFDEQAIDQLHISPLLDDLHAINSLKSHEELGLYLSKADLLGITLPFGYWVDQDHKKPSQYTVYLTQSGLGLPDRDYYFDESEHGQNIAKQYLSYIATVLEEAGIENSKQQAESIYQLEKSLATHHKTRVENRDRDKTYNAYDAEGVAQLFSAIPIQNLFNDVGIGQHQHFVIRQPDYFAKLSDIYLQTPLNDWKSYLQFHLINSYANFLAKPFKNAQFNFYKKTLRGIEEQQPRWKQAIQFTNGSVGELLGELYVAKHYPPEAKQRMEVLVANLFEAYQNSITNLDWMSEETKTKALEKLTKFNAKIGHPEKWRDYSSLDTSPDLLVANVKALRLFKHHLATSKLGQPVDRDEWFISPQTVNAYYSASMNDIVFPAAILQPPFFNLSADDAVNYGAIGGVIGHEIGHGFDDQGSKSDGDGLLTSWWTEQDRKRFDKKGAQLVEQFNQFEQLPGEFVNGQLTLGENIGDLGGLSIALKAYQLSLNGNQAPVIDGFTGEQRVFLGWAQIWRSKRREETQRQLLKTDPHSPAQFRVNGVVRNIDSFYKAFNVGPEHKLYLPPEQRVKIW